MTYLDPFPRGTRISQEFRASPGGYNPPGGHTGRDYAVPAGTPVRAAADGIIRHSSWFTDNYLANPWWLTRYGGDMIVLDCTDAFGRSDTMPTFVYAHLSNSIAEVGQRVKKGQIIALSGNSGTATSGPHCHVERMNPGFDLTNNVYGRAPLNFDEFYTEGSTITPQGTTEEGDDFVAQLTDEEKARWLAACDRINGVVRDAPVLNVKDGAYMNNTRDAQHAEVMAALGQTLKKEDGGYIVRLVESTRPGAEDPEAAADNILKILPDEIAAKVLALMGQKLGEK